MAHALGAGEEGHDLHPVGTFILAAVLKDAPYLMSARTCQKPRILLIPSENVRDAFERDDAFSRSIVLELASCYRGVVREHKDIKLRSAVERLANRLLRYHRDQGATGSVEPYDKRAIASLLGSLKDLKALETLARPSALIDEPEG